MRISACVPHAHLIPTETTNGCGVHWNTKAVIWQVGGRSQMSSARAAWTQLSCVSNTRIQKKKKKSLFSFGIPNPVPKFGSYSSRPQFLGTSHPVAGALGEEVRCDIKAFLN